MGVSFVFRRNLNALERYGASSYSVSVTFQCFRFRQLHNFQQIRIDQASLPFIVYLGVFDAQKQLLLLIASRGLLKVSNQAILTIVNGLWAE